MCCEGLFSKKQKRLTQEYLTIISQSSLSPHPPDFFSLGHKIIALGVPYVHHQPPVHLDLLHPPLTGLHQSQRPAEAGVEGLLAEVQLLPVAGQRFVAGQG